MSGLVVAPANVAVSYENGVAKLISWLSSVLVEHDSAVEVVAVELELCKLELESWDDDVEVEGLAVPLELWSNELCAVFVDCPVVCWLVGVVFSLDLCSCVLLSSAFLPSLLPF